MGIVIWPLEVIVAVGIQIPFKINFTLLFTILLTYFQIPYIKVLEFSRHLIQETAKGAKIKSMSVLTSEAVVLRTWPVHEADLIVSFFTREYGRVRGVAKSALKSRKRFGGALEPMTVARAWFAERPRQELARLDQLEILRSPLSAPVDATRLAVLSFYAELLDEALPDHDPQKRSSACCSPSSTRQPPSTRKLSSHGCR